MSWNTTDRDFPVKDNFLDLIDTQIRQRPEKLAVASGKETLNYRELDELSNRYAHYLLGQGFKIGDLVAVCLSRSCQWLPVLIGVMRAGAAYVPLDVIYPSSRLKYMLDASKAKFLFTEQEFIDGLPDTAAEITCIDTIDVQLKQQSVSRPDHVIRGSDLAYVIFTSGSTGNPKGVQVPHSAVVNFLQSMAETPGLDADDVLLAITTLSFDISVLELFLPLVVGGTTVLANATDASEGTRLSQLMSEHSVTVMQATPGTWRLLLASGWEGDHSLKALCGGEAFPADLKTPLLQRVSALWNMYGPTETTIWSTCGELTVDQAKITVGKPIANTQCYVLDDEGRPCAPGVAGELNIGGLGVSNGYFEQADLTAKAFVHDPFSPTHAIMYRTGDLAQWTSDGQIEVKGRIDSQVKIRGFRIELGEIETHMNGLEVVHQCVATVREDRPGDQRLVAYVVFKDGAELSVVEMRKHLRKFLPAYMIPQHLIPIDSIPTTLNGKINRDSLPKPAYSQAQQIDAHRATSGNASEQWLLTTLRELIGLDHINLDDGFFDVGGNSMMAADLIQRAKTEMNMDIPLSAMALQTISQIAKQYGSEQGDASNGIAVDNQKSKNKNSRIRTFAQNLFSRR
ncbi:MAG: amino acid adenylation domain-containing protein [Pseudomonadales bacterium]